MYYSKNSAKNNAEEIVIKAASSSVRAFFSFFFGQSKIAKLSQPVMSSKPNY